MKNTVRMLHPERAQPEKQPWERQKNEPARYFLLFKGYLALGRGRSLQALWQQEHPVSSDTEANNDEAGAPVLHAVTKVSGTWRKHAAAWHWHERAEEYDAWVRDETHKRLLAFLDHEAQFISAAQRIDALDTMMGGIMAMINKKDFALEDFKRYMLWCKVGQGLLRDIRREMADIDGLTRK